LFKYQSRVDPREGGLRKRALRTLNRLEVTSDAGGRHVFDPLLAAILDQRERQGVLASAAKVVDARAVEEFRGDQTTVPEDAVTGTMIVSSDEEKAEQLDQEMNDVYKGVRAVLAPGRFAKVKQEQIACLKKRDAASSAAEKCKLTEARIKALQDLLW